MRARYVHTNLIARDWRALARFYEAVFGCTPVPPERNYRGAELDAGTGLPHAHLTGVHLRLPGFAADGPTLEIYSYDELESRPHTAVNRPGLGHIAFEVDDVRAAHDEILAAGATAVGQIVTLQTSAGSKVTWCYVADLEGNIIELQSWS